MGQVKQDQQPLDIGPGAAGRRASQQVPGGWRVAASQGSAPSRREKRSRPEPYLVPVRVDWTELTQVAVRLLEVVALDLLVLLGPSALAVHAIGPGDEALVKTGPRPL